MSVDFVMDVDYERQFHCQHKKVLHLKVQCRYKYEVTQFCLFGKSD